LACGNVWALGLLAMAIIVTVRLPEILLALADIWFR